MKTVILCGGKGLRLGGEGEALPKPLVEIDGKPILWHVMKIYRAQGFRDFVLCLGHRGEIIRDRFSGGARAEDWEVAFADTGAETNTGGRLRRIAPRLAGERSVMATYADGLADIDLHALCRFHKTHGKKATMTVVNPSLSFGLVELAEGDRVASFHEKPRLNQWINGGFFVFEREFVESLGENDVLEKEPLERLAREGELMAFRHEGYWQCMDTYKETVRLNELWASGKAPWKIW